MARTERVGGRLSHRTTPLVAVIDADSRSRAAVTGALTGYYTVMEFSDAGAAVEAFAAEPPDVVLVDELMPPEGGFEFTARCRRDRALAGLQILIVTTLDDHRVREAAIEVRATGLVRKPFGITALMRAVSVAINQRVERRWQGLPPTQRAALTGPLRVFNDLPEALSHGRPISWQEVRKSCMPLVKLTITDDIRPVMDAVKDHDNYTFAHSFKVATALTAFAQVLSFSESEQAVVAAGGLLHDVGKVAIPVRVLNKPGRLTEDEWEVMRGHVSATLDILNANPDVPREALTIAGRHHEKLDGSGYPLGLEAAELDDLARMAAIVDVYGALTDRRVYKAGMDPEEAFAIMTESMAPHLDQYLVSRFREVVLDLR